MIAPSVHNECVTQTNKEKSVWSWLDPWNGGSGTKGIDETLKNCDICINFLHEPIKTWKIIIMF